MAIYAKIKEPKNIKDLLVQLFTVHLGQDLSTIATYKDKDCKILQCAAGKMRSFDAILELVNTYFPETTPEKLMKNLLTVKIYNKQHDMCGLIMMNCEDIRRINMIYATDYLDITYDSLVNLHKYGSKYSWKQLLNMIGIDTNEKLKDFIKR